MVDEVNITATFGPAQGDRVTLSKSCRTTLDTIYQHPIADSADPDQPFRPIAITDSGDPDHVVHYA